MDRQYLIDRANSLGEEAITTPEGETWWGYYSYGDAPPAIGGGIGSFVWFPDRNQMLKFMQEVLPYAPPVRTTQIGSR